MQQANIINIVTNKYEPQQKHRLGTVSKNYFIIYLLQLRSFYMCDTGKTSMHVSDLHADFWPVPDTALLDNDFQIVG